jgi:hypothetical protein
MLEVGNFQAKLCQGISRRSFLKAGLLTPFALGMSGNATPQEYGQVRARSVIVLWLWGAPSHLDTFDPKPGAPVEYRGPFSTIPTRTSGMRFAELLPRLASRSDRFAVIRVHKNFHSGHLEAGTTGLTGMPDLSAVMPNFGSILARQRGQRRLPPFIALGRGNPRDVVGVMRGYGGGTWGRSYDPFQVACTERGEIDIPALRLLDGLTPQHLADRRNLVQALDRLRRQTEAGELQRWDANCRRAYELLTSPEARSALDLAGESEQTRAAYGFTSFGQSCLLARRLVQANVPYIQVNWSQYVEAQTPNCDFGWDTHIYNFEMLADRHCPILDRAFSALLDDLRERSLLDSTLVVAMGEFGRTPRINGQASRDHWPNVYSSIWAGAGVRGGSVVGESDRRGEEPIIDPITPLMVGATILDRAGVPSQARAELGVLPGGRVIHELFG